MKGSSSAALPDHGFGRLHNSLLNDITQGNMSGVKCQALASDAVTDGAETCGNHKLSKLGTKGKWVQNIRRDLGSYSRSTFAFCKLMRSYIVKCPFMTKARDGIEPLPVFEGTIGWQARGWLSAK